MCATLRDDLWADFVAHANASGELHLDHEKDKVVTCDMWVQALAALPRAPSTWDDGVHGALLCHLLFSVHDNPAQGAAMQRFRCSPVHGQHGTNTNYWCHELNKPQPARPLNVR